MEWTRAYIARCVAVIAGVIILAGCPQQPVLFVTPLAVTFGDNAVDTEIRIRNNGGGELNWTISGSLPWLSLEDATIGKQGAALSGVTTSGVSVIKLFADREALPFGTTTGQIFVNSNGGSQAVSVSITKTSPPVLRVSETELDFGTSQESAIVTLSNEGRESLNYTVTPPASAPWLTVAPVEGTIQPSGTPAALTFRVNRQALAGGDYSAVVPINSNGGTASISVRLQVPPFSAQPTEIQFGAILSEDSEILRLRNLSASSLVLLLDIQADGGDWLSLSRDRVNVAPQTVQEVTVNANADGLAPGPYSGLITVSDNSGNFSIEVPVTMSVAAFSISRNILDFGEISQETQDSFVLSNLGTVPLPYSIEVPVEAAAWLSAAPLGGELTGNETVTVTVDPTAVDPGAYEATLLLDFVDGVAEVIVRFTRPIPPTLVVEPSNIDLGANKEEELIDIWNRGIGSIDWAIDTSNFPAWLTVTPVSGQGAPGGTVSGNATDSVQLRVFRNLLPANQTTFEFSFEVSAAGDTNVGRTVNVRGRVPLIPEIDFETDGIDNTGTPFLTIDANQNDKTFILRNNGNGTLVWNIAPATIPNWITSISPSQGEIAPGTQRAITISVSRASLNYLGAQATLVINSNDPRVPALPLRVEIVVPKQVLIDVRPSTLSFGLTTISDIVEVSNAGDPETVLNFRVTSSKEWLSVFPETGQSIGTSSPFKDWRPISVTVDRSQLEGAGSSAVLTVTAFTVQNGEAIPLPGVTPGRIEVSVEAAELTIQSAKPRLRIPSMVRSVLLMRNLRFQALPIPQSRLGQIGSLFNIFENDVPLEVVESNQFLTSSDRIRGNALILLDYSNSMQEAARSVQDPDIFDAPDPLQRLYERSISSLIDELPANYRIGLAVFNERGGAAVRRITSSPLDNAATLGETFIEDRNILRSRLSNIEVIDNGASPIFQAIGTAATILINEDRAQNFIPFDDADVRALITVTDGRVTTPPGSITELATFLEENYVRLFAVGWGQGVAANPLLRLTQPSGGHLYSTRNQPTGELDAFGAPVRRPVAAELENWMVTNPLDECDQSIAKDFRSQVVFSYITLNEEAGVSNRTQLTFNDPNDQDSPCIPEQGEISGSFTGTQLDFDRIVGDPRLGQISLNTNGLVNGAADIIARLEFAPRNVSSFTFTVSPDSGSMEVSTIPQTAGGVAFNWSLQQNGNVYTLTSPDAPLRYGEFGDLLRFRVTGANAPLLLSFEVDQPSISATPDSKYFTHPDTILVEANERFKAPAFPYPVFETLPDANFNGVQYVIELGSDIDETEITLFNLGGSHTPTLAGLFWELIPAEQVGILRITQPQGNPIIGSIFSTLSPDTIRIQPDRSLEPGDYFGIFDLVVDYGSIGIFQEIATFRINYSVGAPELDVAPTSLDFGAAEIELPLTITNTGQSTLTWIIDVGALPIWLSTSRNTFSLTGGESIVTNMRVNRTGLAPGVYTYNMPIQTSGSASATIPIQMTVP